ncbi:MAG: GxxExxY protein [Patescibacteria group bacterium]
MSKYTPTIGLEIHAELKTQTKMFCNSKNDSEEKRPNVNICPVCMGHPGTLPTINKEAVKHVLKLGLAVNGTLGNFTEFDRKNYFYPDIPKGYQISQYKHPLVLGGEIKGIKLTRIHLEEDTARSIHQGEESLIDFNRAGVPLMELVTEPVIHSGEEAVTFARELQLLLQYLHAGDANMEKGEMRVEANISVAPINADDIETQIDADKNKLLYEDLSYKIRGAAFGIYNILGSGHKESEYQNAFAQHLDKIGVAYVKEKHIAVTYENKKVGSYQPDFVIDNKIIVEIKALPFVGRIEKAQVQYYLKNSSYRLAMIVNFGSSPIHIERIIYDSIRDNLPSYPRQSAILGTKVEVKNLNSFRAVERAINFEIERQSKFLERGEEIIQETRGWDEGKGNTFSQRAKEDSHDYRYFPDPDLPKLYISEIPDFSKEKLLSELPELPWQKRERYIQKFGLKEIDVEIFIHQKEWCELFERTIANFKDDKKLIQLASNYITSDIAGLSKSTGILVGNITPDFFASLIQMIGKGEVSSRGGKDLLKVLYEKGGEPSVLAKKMNLIQKSDEETLLKIVKKIIEAHPNVVADYKAGKENALQFLVGQMMKESKGSANPQILQKLIKQFLG